MSEITNFDGLSPRQLNVLCQIAVNQDGGHPKRTLEALEAKGLIVRRDVPVRGASHLTIHRWEVPLPVHIAWAEWCARQPDEDAAS